MVTADLTLLERLVSSSLLEQRNLALLIVGKRPHEYE